MILLPINKRIVKLLREQQIPSDYLGSALIVLLCLYHKNYTLLDELDDENSDLLFLHVYMDLTVKGIIQKTKEEDTVHFELTEVGFQLVQLLLKEKTNNKVVEDKPLDLSWVEEWRNLWRNPRGQFYKSVNDNGSERSLGASRKDIESRFMNFLQNYEDIFDGFDYAEIILGATEQYIKEEQKSNFNYTKNSMNFICKQEGSTKDTKASTLAMKCEEYIVNLKNQTVVPMRTSFDNSIN